MAPKTTYRLNIFQRAALSWDRMLPYNAAHVVRAGGALDIQRLHTSIHTCLDRYGLGSLRLDEKTSRFGYETLSERPPVEVLPPSDNVLGSLKNRLELELNRPFTLLPPSLPIRFFVVQDGENFYLGLVYFHVIADASSIIFLLNDILRCYESGLAPNPHPGRLYPQARLGTVSLIRGFFDWLRTLPHDVNDVRRTLRVSWINGAPKRAGLLLEKLPLDGRKLAEKCRTLGVTANDLFLAALLKSVPPLRGKKKSAHRSRLSVGSIISTRRDLGLNGGKEFGLFLSSFRVSASSPEQYSLTEMAADVRRQTQRVKKFKLHLRNMMETSLGLRLETLVSSGMRDRFYAKHYPLAAGLTNMDLNALWEPSGEPIPDYWRAVSTNRAVPMVFSVTSAAASLNISVSFSMHVYTKEEAVEALSHFVGHLREFALG